MLSDVLEPSERRLEVVWDDRKLTLVKQITNEKEYKRSARTMI